MKNTNEKEVMPPGVIIMIVLNVLGIVFQIFIVATVLIIMLLSDTLSFDASAIAKSSVSYGFLLGMELIALIFQAITLIFMCKRKYIPLVVCLVLGLLQSCLKLNIPAIVSFIVLFSDRRTKQYIKYQSAAKVQL